MFLFSLHAHDHHAAQLKRVYPVLLFSFFSILLTVLILSSCHFIIFTSPGFFLLCYGLWSSRGLLCSIYFPLHNKFTSGLRYRYGLESEIICPVTCSVHIHNFTPIVDDSQ
ncbi:hypothetical protein BO85DRAFT_92470 [Aspergillus piperis CBS 112811]|uniref:Uncharacterized protein n=1 Tax=Aspergillus piperis CBS 112811 TaxID=1448313 RepID=A0A8G1QY21_9EURO|nr:hypothetical protein BO85DRAFT_92470 [Aspergillus piperis CBS 112811]RAH55096.1 hypothetical protein BO85DRAFT_92470 [Aspergillus piperis CBS 112811]